ncbi:ABC transporter ATP-binding protein [Bacillus sp. 03113]|uniref:ABC transporter ATP-binding protein n=1 Tax=Bacillus sp. 03113 TaxID=2578211 RepID=UPI0011443462|nr:sn-glycerol-3-phosphate ABC transporter ATP-binding protein UgpC [Bacillus sp. 03113]
MAGLSFKHVKKRYDNNPYTVKDFHLEVKDKEFLVLVGPSGCGKSTTLRMIAGLEDISEGEFYIGDRLVNDVAPKDRDIAMVFQSYALYPHMTVFDNMAFSLKLRKVPKKEIEKQVMEAAKILNLEPLLKRKPKALSGGQRQRVALGRAIVRHPQVFLMDEPLSNLDAKLRVQMRSEISKLHKRLETTFVYVTHDQTEAMTMGDRIVVMYDGEIQQVATPTDIYEFPVNKYVAGFIGSPSMNFIDGEIIEEGTNLFFKGTGVSLQISEEKASALRSEGYIGKEISFGIRPEDIYEASSGMDTFPEIKAEIDVVENMGSELYLYAKINSINLIAKVKSRIKYSFGDQITLAIDMNKCHFFDKSTEKAIR